MIEISLSGGALSAQRSRQGYYQKSARVNGQLSWKHYSSDNVLWWAPKGLGKFGSKGSGKAYWKVGNVKMNMGYLDTYDAEFPVFGPPYGNQSGNSNVWSYLNDDNDWVNAPVGEIIVECAHFEDVQSKYNIYYYILLNSSRVFLQC